MSPANGIGRVALALVWAGLLAIAGWLLGQRLELSGDLRKFMPQAQTPAQKLLIDELGEGPGSRLLLVALSGSDAEVLANQSAGLRERLLAQPDRFELVANGGEAGLDAFPEHLRPYRYLLTPTADTQAFDRACKTLQDFGSAVPAIVADLIIGAAKTGERDPGRLYEQVLNHYGIDDTSKPVVSVGRDYSVACASVAHAA